MAIKDIHFPVKLDQNPKRQGLKCIEALKKRYKLERGEMKITIAFDKLLKDELTHKLKQI